MSTIADQNHFSGHVRHHVNRLTLITIRRDVLRPIVEKLCGIVNTEHLIHTLSYSVDISEIIFDG